MQLGTQQIYYVLDNGQQYGPCSESEIAQCVAGGTFTPAAQVWREGSPVWSPLPPQIAAMAPRQSASWPVAYATPSPAASKRAPKGDRSPFMTGMLVTFGVIAALLIVGFATGFIGGFSRAVNAPSRVTYAQYQNVQVGMTYRQVVDTLGREGVQHHLSDGLGEWYSWDNDDFSTANVWFRNGRATSKTQFNLK